jgi:hypothetical protein
VWTLSHCCLINALCKKAKVWSAVGDTILKKVINKIWMDNCKTGPVEDVDAPPQPQQQPPPLPQQPQPLHPEL